MIKAVLAQLSPVLGDKEKNLKKIEKAVSSSGAELAVFGELFLTGYMVRDALPRLAEGLSGKSVKEIQRISGEYGCSIVVGMPEACRARRGLVYNSALVVQPDGNAATYRKLHLANFGPFEEKQYFAAGSGAPVFKTSAAKLGVIICYDLFFPELAKTYALSGADIIVCISASPSTTRPFFEKALVARAIENTTFVLYSNLVGTELNMVFWGGCQAYGPRGDLLAKGKYFKDELVTVELDLKELEVARHFRPTLRNTRADVLDNLRKSL